MKIVRFEANATATMAYAESAGKQDTPWGAYEGVGSPAWAASKGAPMWEEYISRTGLTRHYAAPAQWAGRTLTPVRRDWRDAIRVAIEQGQCIHWPDKHLAEWASGSHYSLAHIVTREALFSRVDELTSLSAVPTIRDWWLVTTPCMTDTARVDAVVCTGHVPEQARPHRAAYIEWANARKLARRFWRSRMERWVFEIGSGLWAVVDNPQDEAERAILADRKEYVVYLANYGVVDKDFDRLNEAVRKEIS